VPCVKLSCHDNQFDCFLKPVENNQRNIIAMSRLKADSKNMFFFSYFSHSENELLTLEALLDIRPA
jgi:hypothetical protein